MDIQPSPAEATDHGWWLALLEQLQLSIEELVDDFIRRLSELAPRYPGVSSADLRETAINSLGLLISQLAGHPNAIELQRFATQLGIRRARQNVDRDSLLEAVRLDYRVLWSGLARITPSYRSAQLLLHSEDVLSTVEQYVRDVQVAFLNERDALAQSSRANETRAVARLLSAEDPSLVCAEVAELLGVSASSNYEVVLVPTDASSEAMHISRDQQRTRRRFIIWDYDDCVLFFRELQPDLQQHVFDGIRSILIENVTGLAEVPTAAANAHRLVPFLSEFRLYRDHELWLQLAAKELRSVLPGLGDKALTDFRTLPELEQERLLTNFLSFCETGSIKATAEATFVHRNTVVNRLRAFQTATGFDPTIPAQAAKALMLVS